MSDYTTNSTWLQNVADALAAVAGGLSLANGVEVKAIVWAPRETGKRPAAVVELPSIERVKADEAESQIGSRDVRLNFPVVFYFDLTDSPQFAQTQAAETVEAFVDALDAAKNAGNPLATDQLEGSVVIDAKAQVDPPEIMPGEESSARPAIRYVCRAEVLAFIPDV